MPAKGAATKKEAAKRKASEDIESAQAKELKQEVDAGVAVVAPVAETKEGSSPGPEVVAFLNLLQQAPEGKEACHTWFKACADVLLNHFEVVVAGNKVFKFIEIEFYYNDHNAHQDTFIHGSELQLKTAGHWYFHTAGASGASYKSGSYKGLDLTFGRPGKIPGGILLRAMEAVGGEVIEGPCLLVDRLLKENKKDSILDLVKTGFSLCATDVNPFMYIRPASKPAGRVVVGSPRVGLTLKRHDAFKETFVMMPYRMTSLTSKIKKNRHAIILALHAQGRAVSDIVTITGAKKANVEEYTKQLAACSSATKVPSDWNGANLDTGNLIGLFAACKRAGNV